MVFCKAQDKYATTQFGVDIPEVALLNLKSSSEVILNPLTPAEAGLSLDFTEARSTDVWINYSSVLAGNRVARNISAAVEGEIPEGVVLKVIASPDAGFGGGQMGTPVGEVTLSNTMQPVISGIGSCYTGVGVNKGCMLTYFLELNDKTAYSGIQDKSYTLTVLFTLGDEE